MRKTALSKTASLTFYILVVALFLASTSLVFAQEETAADEQVTPEATNTPSPTSIPSPDWNLDITVSPVSLNIETKPGVPVTSTVKVKNNGIGPEHIHIDIAKFKADESGAHPQLLDVTPADEFVNWLSFSERDFVVQPNEWKSVEVTFSPPADAALGYYITLIFNRQQIEKPGKLQTVISGAPAILMLATVDSPNVKKELQLIDFYSDKSFYEYLPAKFTVRVKNTGNIHIIPAGDVFIDKGSTKDVAVLSINKSASNILGGTEREYSVTWDDGFPVWTEKSKNGTVVLDENGNPVKELKWDFSNANKLRFGKYTAHLLMAYDNGVKDVPLEATISFWVIPWKLILIVLTVLFFAGVGVWATLKSFAKKARRR